MKTYNEGPYIKRPLAIMKCCAITTLVGSVFIINGCGAQQEGAEHTVEDAAYSEDMTVNEQASDALNIGGPAGEASEKIQIDNLSQASKMTLGSQITDQDIEGKDLVISASAVFKVDDVSKTRQSIENLTYQQGGYVASSYIQSNEVDWQNYTQQDKDIKLVTYYHRAKMTVRIPKQKVTDFLNQVQQQVKFLEFQEFTAKDVTLDLYRGKLEAQLNQDMAQELNEQRLNSDNEKEQASNIESIKETYSAKRRKQLAELDELMIADQIKYSTIELTFTEPYSVYKEVTDNVDSIVSAERPGFWQQAKQSIIDGWEMIKSVILGVISLWWLWVLLSISFIIYRGSRTTIRRFFDNDSE